MPALATSNRGLTLVEVVVALLLLSVGLVALAGVTVTVTRLATRGQQSTQLAALLGERIEIIETEACDAPHSGMEVRAPFRVTWTVVIEGPGRRVTVSGRADGGAVRPVTISRFVGCAA